MLDRALISRLCKYRKSGHSYDEIARKFGVPKSTVQYNTRSVVLDGAARKRLDQKISDNRREFSCLYSKPLSKERLGELEALRRCKITLDDVSRKSGISLSCVKKYLRGNTIKAKPIIPSKLSLEQARIIAHCMFDGYVSTTRDYAFGYSNKCIRLIDQFTSNVSDVYGMKPYVYIDKKSCCILNYYSKDVVNDLLRFTESYSTANSMLPTRIPNEILEASEDIKRAFLRAFWDDEGSVSLSSRKGSLIGVSFNDSVLYGLAKLHKDIGIECLVKPKRHEIAMHRKSEILKFSNRIGFSKGALVTRGKWIGFEKQEILDRLISSYRA